MSPNNFVNFAPPCHFFWGGGRSFFACCGRCALIQTQVLKNVFLMYGPLSQWWGLGSKLRVPLVDPPVGPYR